VSFASTGSGSNHGSVGGGIGGGFILPLVRDKLNFQFSGLWGPGVGRYGTAQLPDATFSPTGVIQILTGYSLMGGLVARPIPSVDIYAYGGAEGVNRKYSTPVAGYGNPFTNLSGCFVELGTCNANTSNVVEGTIGAWWRFIQGPYGTMQAGLQYEYVNRNTFNGSGTTAAVRLTGPTSNENIIMFSFRYLPLG
ncbi:MAG: hypothetical protein JOZ17_19945, partial [Acetobacteraceae bacterium]|nr:hypothetical protein [Acetobacteraceae bacterium]